MGLGLVRLADGYTLIYLVLVCGLNVDTEILLIPAIDIKINDSFFVSVNDQLVIST